MMCGVISKLSVQCTAHTHALHCAVCYKNYQLATYQHTTSNNSFSILYVTDYSYKCYHSETYISHQFNHHQNSHKSRFNRLKPRVWFGSNFDGCNGNKQSCMTMSKLFDSTDKLVQIPSSSSGDDDYNIFTYLLGIASRYEILNHYDEHTLTFDMITTVYDATQATPTQTS